VDRDSVVGLADRTGLDGLGYLMLVVLLGGTTVGELCLVARRERHAVSEALRELELRHLVVRVQNGRGFRWFPSEEAGLFMCTDDGRKTYQLHPTTATAIDPPGPKLAAAAAARNDGRKTYQLPAGVDQALAKALRSAGIGSNAWPDLAALEHVTPAYVRAHAAYARARGDSVGLLITRIRCGDPVPRAKRARRGEREDVGLAWMKVIEGRKKVR